MKHRVRQIDDGFHYRGRLEIGKATFKFDLQLENRLAQKGEGAHIFPANVKALKIEKDGHILHLNEEAKALFWHLIFKIVEHMRSDKLVREINRRVKNTVQAAMKGVTGARVVRICVDLETTQKEFVCWSAHDKQILNSYGCAL